MFEKMLNREADIHIKSGTIIKGFITNIQNGFVEINEQGEFECSIVSLGEIAVIRGKTQWVETKYSAKEVYTEFPTDTENTVRIAAKVGKRSNDFAMPLSAVQEKDSYVPPSFVRETPRGEK